MGLVKKYSINLLLLCFSVLFIVILAETYLRLTGYGRVGHREGNIVRHISDEFNHTAVLNTYGLRGESIGEKGEDEFRILVIGDSFTYGLGVEEQYTFVRQAETKLAELMKDAGDYGTAKIINCGISKSGPMKQGEWLLERGMDLEPDMVVMAFYIGNDVYDDIIWRESNSERTTGNLNARASLRKVLFVDWLWSRLVSVPLFDKFMFDLGLRYSNRGLFMKDIPHKEKEALILSMERINWVNKLLRKKGITFHVMIIPTTDQVRYPYGRPDDENFKLPNKLLTSYFIKKNIKFIDLLPLMLSKKDNAEFYYNRDPHWTRKGHAFAAGVLSKKLKDFL